MLAVALVPCLALLPLPGRARPPSMVAATTDYLTWAADHGIVAPKVALAPESEADERGVVATSAVAAMEVVATVPQELVLSTHAGAGWAGRLTEEVLTSRAQGGEGRRAERPWSSAWGSSSAARRSWVAQWRYTGWSTASEDRVSADERSRFHKEWRSSAGLLTTGSDTDVEIYRKFGLPTHPAIDRASIWLSLLTETSLPAARDALEARGFEWRRCRDTLRPLVDLADLDLAEEIADAELGGSQRERCERVAAALFSRVIARATHLDDGAQVAVVPLHERLGHCGEAGANVRLVCGDPFEASEEGGKGGSKARDVLLVATRAIAAGEALTRDYSQVPRLEPRPPLTAPRTGCKKVSPPDEDLAPMLLLLQSGLRLEGK